jgi:hypothetical protein
MVFGTFLVTTLLSAEPRYYLMVLPTLMLGWLMFFAMVARKVPRFWGEAILCAGLAIVVLNNLSATVHFFIEQHRSNFIAHYKRGTYVPVLAMAEQIRLHVRPDQKVLGPSGSIMSVFSGVHVYTQRELLPKGDAKNTPERIAAAGLEFAVCPGALYRDKEPVIARLMDRRLIAPVKLIHRMSDQMYLAAIKVYAPAGDWRKLPPDWRPPPEIKPVKKKPTTATASTKPSRKKRTATTRPASTRPARRVPATRPSTRPTTMSTSQPLRAMTTMLSPVLLCASGPVKSLLDVYDGSLLILEAARSTCGWGFPLEIVSFLTPK